MRLQASSSEIVVVIVILWRSYCTFQWDYFTEGTIPEWTLHQCYLCSKSFLASHFSSRVVCYVKDFHSAFHLLDYLFRPSMHDAALVPERLETPELDPSPSLDIKLERSDLPKWFHGQAQSQIGPAGLFKQISRWGFLAGLIVCACFGFLQVAPPLPVRREDRPPPPPPKARKSNVLSSDQGLP